VIVPVGILAAAVLGLAAGRSSLRLWLGWFALALLPVMPVRPTSLYLYVPMMGLAMLFAAAFQRSGQAAFAAWLIITGIVGGGAHLFAQRYIAGVWQTSREQVVTLDRWIRERGATRLVTIDTPVWHYALPAAVELDSPDLRFDTWFVNFKPRLNAVESSPVRWRTDLQLEITAPPGGFLHSGFERFLAFGGTPPDRPAPAPQSVEVAIEGPRTDPRRLVVTFQDAAIRDSTLIVRFTRDGLRRIEPVRSSVPGRPVPGPAGGGMTAPSSARTAGGAGT
jgi:hypothetical protein